MRVSVYSTVRATSKPKNDRARKWNTISKVVLENPTHAPSPPCSLLPKLLTMKTDICPSVPDPGHPYVQLQQQIREALRREHPEWIGPNGQSPICEAYESRLAKLLGVPSLTEYRPAA